MTNTIENKYDIDTWFQVSRRHRTLARLPEGKTGVEALRDAELKTWYARFPEMEFPPHRHMMSVQLNQEDSAGDFFLRVHAGYTPELCVSLTREEFDAFRKAGGDTYMTRWYMKKQGK